MARKSGVCQACGPVSLYYRKHKDQWMCATARREQRGMVASRTRSSLGITARILDEMLDAQGSRCAICSDPIDRSAHVDHDHATGKIRGLLCRGCNLGLGHFRDRPLALLAAVDYLAA